MACIFSHSLPARHFLDITETPSFDLHTADRAALPCVAAARPCAGDWPRSQLARAMPSGNCATDVVG
jgi:hypothetical protein